MLNRLTPFFNLDGGGAASESTGDWLSLAQSTGSETPVDEGQAELAPDTEGLEETEPNAEGQEEVEPDPNAEKQDDPADTSFNDETEVDLGEGRQPVKLAELKQGYLRQSDYTKKTQELSTQRKEFETLQTELEPIKGLNDFLTSNPWLSQQINHFVQEFQNTGNIPLDDALADAQYGQYINHLMAENQKLTKQLDKVNGDYEGVKLTTEMNTLRSDLQADYGELVTDEYINTLQERGKTEKLSTTTLKEIAEGHLTKQKLQQEQTDKKKLTKETEAKTIQQLQEQRNANPPGPKSTGQRPSAQTKDVGEMSWLELAKSSSM